MIHVSARSRETLVFGVRGGNIVMNFSMLRFELFGVSKTIDRFALGVL